MATNSRIRPPKGGNMKRGICCNQEYLDPDTGKTGPCPKCASGEIQHVNVQRLSDFKCSVCGSRLKAAKPETPWKIIITVACILALGGGIWAWLNSSDSESPSEINQLADTVISDSIVTSPAEKDVVKEDTAEKDTVIPSTPRPRPVFGGAAFLSADRSVITFKRAYNLDLHTMDGETLYVYPGDKIRGAKIINGRLVSGEYVSRDGEERYLSGLNNKL